MRENLGDFSSIVCFKAVITGMEKALGEKATAIAITNAGRTRGKNLISELKLNDKNLSWDEIAIKLNEALGKKGTRLCIIHRIEQVEDIVKVYASETICSAEEPQGSSRKCTYTLGTVWGALEQLLGKKFYGKQTESVLQDGNYDVFEFTLTRSYK
jgi:predicted hydrocarbon binding protein